MSLFVKICGLCSEADVRAVAALKPDALGFVFWAGSKRCVRPAAVAAWTRDLPAGPLRVGVFVDESAEGIARIVREAGLDVVQLHGFQTLEKKGTDFPNLGKNDADFSEPWKLFEAGFPNLGKKENVFSKVWKVVHLGRGEDPSTAEAARVDAFLVDSYSADSPGGTGRVGDWAAAAAFARRCGKPVVLAGGLTPDNVADAVRAVRPWGVDVSSGVERAPRQKDMEKVERFIRTCRENA